MLGKGTKWLPCWESLLQKRPAALCFSPEHGLLFFFFFFPPWMFQRKTPLFHPKLPSSVALITIGDAAASILIAHNYPQHTHTHNNNKHLYISPTWRRLLHVFPHHSPSNNDFWIGKPQQQLHPHPPPLLPRSLSGLCSQQNSLVLCSIELGKINDCRVGVGWSLCVCLGNVQCFCQAWLRDQNCQIVRECQSSLC